MNVRTVIKRDGRKAEFDISKIIKAITKAVKTTDNAVITNDDIIKIAVIVSKNIADNASIEDIQNLVEKELMNIDKEVAKEYILYRNQRTEARERKKASYQQIRDMTFGKMKINANANVDEQSYGGRKNEAAEILHKEIALNELIDPEVAYAHKNGLVYEHDLGNYTVGMHNCLFLDFKNMWENHKGFSTRNGDCREPQNYSTACQQTAVSMQCQSQVERACVKVC